MKTPWELFGVECGKGWRSLVEPILKEAAAHGVDVMQVKEKYGTLRIYLGPAPHWLLDMCEEAEEKSETVCEECGAPGKLREGSWLRTLCDEHAR